jgi:hypothetical protein
LLQPNEIHRFETVVGYERHFKLWRVRPPHRAVARLVGSSSTTVDLWSTKSTLPCLQRFLGRQIMRRNCPGARVQRSVVRQGQNRPQCRAVQPRVWQTRYMPPCPQAIRSSGLVSDVSYSSRSCLRLGIEQWVRDAIHAGCRSVMVLASESEIAEEFEFAD